MKDKQALVSRRIVVQAKQAARMGDQFAFALGGRLTYGHCGGVHQLVGKRVGHEMP